eukprot:4569954-Prymnesium_polylepis.2
MLRQCSAVGGVRCVLVSEPPFATPGFRHVRPALPRPGVFRGSAFKMGGRRGPAVGEPEYHAFTSH